MSSRPWIGNRTLGLVRLRDGNHLEHQRLFVDEYAMSTPEADAGTAQSTVRRSGGGDAVLTTDGSGRITSMNAVAEMMTGWKRHDALGLPVSAVFRIATRDGKPAADPVMAALRGGPVPPAQLSILTDRLGTTRLIDHAAEAMQDAAGGVSGTVLVFRAAIVFHRNAIRVPGDTAMASSEERYRRLFEAAQDGILILDAVSLEIIDANDFMTRLLGYKREDLVGKELWEIGFLRDKEASQALYQELQDVGYVRYEHIPLETRAGNRAEVEFIANVYEMGDRMVAQCNIRDITERSRLERKLHAQAEELAALDRRKDEFLAMLSHELRNPLAPISNSVHLLRLQPAADPVQDRAYAIIDRQVKQLTRLVDDLMEVSRITTGRVQLRLELTAIDEVIGRALETTRPLTNQRRQHVTVSNAERRIWVSGDAARLEQVMVNLITNAAKYTDDGGRISVSVTQEGGECVIRVDDTGIGMAPDILPHIFELFTQAHPSLDRSRGGLGIGLALVDRIVKMHHGNVSVSSVPGEGSRFTIRLPAAALVAASPSPAASVVKAQSPAGALRVLVVDDSPDTAETLALLVNTLGHDARRAHDGPGVLRAAIDHRPHVVLLDIGLPGIDGYEVAAQLRGEPVLEGVVLVAITGYGHASDRQRSHAAGFDHHLVKPPDLSKLEAILVAACHRRAARAG